MWNEMLEAYPKLRLVPSVMSGDYSLSFEMYGHRNVVAVIYKESLTTRLLFGVNQKDGSISIPENFSQEIPKALVPTMEASLQSGEDIVEFYEKMRTAANVLNKDMVQDDGRVALGGTEGYVFYNCNIAGQYDIWKCKSEAIEEMHWASDHIPKSVVMATTINAMESCDELTPAYVVQLLLEEFSETQVENSEIRIANAINDVLERIKWREFVKEKWDSITDDIEGKTTPAIMKVASKHFDRGSMGRVFSALCELGVIKQ